MVVANLALRFIIELTGAAAFGYWGLNASSDAALRAAAGIGAPLVMIGLWSAILAPKASSFLAPAQKTLVGTVVLEVAAAALAASGQATLAVAFGVVVALNGILLLVFRGDTAAIVN